MHTKLGIGGALAEQIYELVHNVVVVGFSFELCLECLGRAQEVNLILSRWWNGLFFGWLFLLFAFGEECAVPPLFPLTH